MALADGRSDPGPATPPKISLPTGGGAIRGIGEKFTANAVTGTGSVSLPISVSSARSGFGPDLSLSYDSGRGNGLFGFGWDVALPSITRRTAKGLPRYSDDSDVFLFSDTEDLVPVLESESGWTTTPVTIDGYRIERFRPRIDTVFARIERWTRLTDGDVHWRSTTRDNITSWYGIDTNSRVADPHHPERVFSWLICRSHDSLGNAISYEYAAENSAGIELGAAHEQHRAPLDRTAARHPKRIRYGNRVSRLVDPDLSDPDWMFEVVFDYGEHDLGNPLPTADPEVWSRRPDPFSTYRAGFEVRTYRLCRRVLVYHHFPGAPGVGADCLVRSTDFGYQPGDAVGMFLTSATQVGHRRDGNGYLSRAMPPVEFGYSPAQLQDTIIELDRVSLENVPAGLAGSGVQWADLDGEGVSGLLLDQADSWWYKANLGSGQFGPARQLPTLPSNRSQTTLMDLAGDGRLDVVSLSATNPGFIERTDDGNWDTFQAFASWPVIDWSDSNVRFADLDGDGHSDVLITEDGALTWYPSLAEEGFAAAEQSPAPRVVFADGTGSIRLADMSGDGLSDLVRIRNGEVSYWPNLGYGRFGQRVAMDNAPWFDQEEDFDQSRLLLADVDGSGVTDIVYVTSDEVRVFLNRSGNSWTAVHRIGAVPEADAGTAVTAVDLFGSGTTCLVWSSTRPGEEQRSMRCLDLLGGNKPHLLARMDNNLGSRTVVEYASSTEFYLADKRHGRPWVTRLPFPVQLVKRVETIDLVSHHSFVTRYVYHHGFFDGIEREFRGFGLVEQWDADDVDGASSPPMCTKTWFHTGAFVDVGASVSRHFAGEYWREPGLTPEQHASRQLDDTVWPTGIRLLNGTVVPHDPSAAELRDACRALKGSILRQEVFALDGSDAEPRPYSVTERSHEVELVQPRNGEQPAVCFVHPVETVNFHYERKLYDVEVGGVTVQRADPRIIHELVLDVDGWGNVLRSARIGYRRRYPDADLDPLLTLPVREAIAAAQTTDRALLNVAEYTDAVLTGGSHRAPAPAESRTYELLQVVPDDGLIRPSDLRALVDTAADLPYEDVTGAGAVTAQPYRRLVEQSRIRYRADDLSGPLASGQLGSRGLPYETYRLAFTPGLLDSVFRRTLPGQPEEDLLPDPLAVLGPEGGYVYTDGNWWIPSGQILYSPEEFDSPAQELAFATEHFFMPSRFVDAFGGVTLVRYEPNDLLLWETRDPVGNRVSAGERADAADPEAEPLTNGLDYRVLAPWVVSDANRNRSAVSFDALGMVVATATKGKPEETVGDSLDDVVADLPTVAVTAHFADPLADPQALLGSATTRLIYDLFAFHRTRDDPQPQPVAVANLFREIHASELGPQQQTPVRHRLSYSDGFGREIQAKAPAEPGPLFPDGPVVGSRWVGSGWTVYNTKDLAIRKYEPFFSETHNFELAMAVGVSALLCYDPIGRPVTTLYPNNSYGKTVFDPWRHVKWDGNDTVLLDPRTDDDVSAYLADHFAGQPPGWQTWYQQRAAGALGPREQAAAEQTVLHAGTPGVGYADTLGRVAITVAHNRYLPSGTVTPVDERHPVRKVLDIEGAELALIDARGVTVLQSDFDVAGRAVHTHSPDAGEHWYIPDVGGVPVRRWDSRGHSARHEYDLNRRPARLWVIDPGVNTERLVTLTAYGESDPSAEQNNLRAQIWYSFDGSGFTAAQLHDFKGNLVATRRRLAQAYTETPDWSALAGVAAPDLEAAAASLLEPEVFSTAAEYDALNRATTQVLPDGTALIAQYNEAGLLEAVSTQLAGTGTGTPFILAASYDAQGRRERVDYGADGVVTEQDFDPLTFQLRRLHTTRGNQSLQDLTYVYDPVGNITSISDQAQQTVFFDGQVVAAVATYGYDATYRLIEATGREHASLGPQPDYVPPDRQDLPHPNDSTALRTYTQRYGYDPAGNILTMAHLAGPGSWTRQYTYSADSNQLVAHSVPGGGSVSFQHDDHGNMTGMPHLGLITWDYHDQMVSADLGGGGTAYYTYDGFGERVRRVIDRIGGLVEDHIYLAGFEIYRKRLNSVLTFERQTVRVTDDQQLVALAEVITVDTGAPQSIGQWRQRYQLGDHLGSTSLEVDADGAIISYEEYHPYGTSSLWLATDAAEVSAKRYRYNGKERDSETQLSYYGARYYAPWLARWTSYDPGGVRDGASHYMYVRGNPVALYDPDGAEEKSCAAKAKSVGVLANLFPQTVGYAVRPQLNPCLDGHPGWQQWHAETEKKASLASATLNRNVAAAAAGTVTAAYTLTYAGVTMGVVAGPTAAGAGNKLMLWALTNPQKVLVAQTLLQFGIGLADPHPPGGSPVDLPGPADDVGRLARSAVVREVGKVLGPDEVVKLSVRTMKPKQLMEAVEKTWELDKSGLATWRGEILEGALAATRYKFYEWVGRLQGGFYKGIDFYANRIGIQLKTMNPQKNVPSVTEYKGFIDNLLAMKKAGILPDKRPITGAALDIAIPQGYKGPKGKETEFAKAMKEIVDYGKLKGIAVTVYELTEKQMNLVLQK